MNFLLDLQKYDLIVPVFIGLLKDGDKEEFIQSLNLINVHKDCLRFFSADDLFIYQWCLKIGNNYA
jgi:hypothetical protein